MFDHPLRRAQLLVLCVLGLLACALPVCAQQASGDARSSRELTPFGQEVAAEPGAEPARVPPLVSTWDFVRMLLVLAAVVAVIYLLFVVLRRSSRRATIENDLITLLGSKNLSGNRSLHLVRVGKSLYLVGSAEGNVGLIAEIGDKETVDQVLLSAEKQRAPGRKSFTEILSGLVPQGGGGQLALPDGLGFLRRQRDRLKRLRSV